ncbi:hypothetical protein [Albidovulum sp.]|uniref:hypothetical protein n=1 Tax=Albidovulum sp. TaxID=1872424 RepID=UPI0039B97A3D
MLKLRQGAGFLLEQVEYLAEFRRAAFRAKSHRTPRAAADRSGKALLDDDLAAKTVAREVCDPEPAGIQIGFDRVLPAAQYRPRRQFVPEGIELTDNSYVRRLVQFCSLGEW